MTDEAPKPTPGPPPSDDSIHFDLSCVRCGYNLRELPRTGRCPECGRDVELSLSGRFLMNADPGWLRTIRWGVELRIITILAFFVSLVIPESPVFSVPHRFTLALFLSAIATYQLTNTERAASAGDPTQRSRSIARTLGALGATAGAITAFEDRFLFPSICIGSVSLLMDIAFLRHIAERVPDEKLAAASQSIGWALGACCAFAALCSALWAFATLIGTGIPEFGPLLMVVPCFAIVAIPVGGITCFVLLCVYAGVIREQIKAGARNRSAEP